MVSKRYGFYLRISHELSAAKRVRCFGHEKIKSISFGSRVMFFLLYGRRTSFFDFFKFSENLRKCSEIFGDIYTNEDMENILSGTRMFCHMDSMSGIFSSKTLLPI